MKHVRPTVAIVCGLPATGKTTLSLALRDELGWPLLAKDRLKELLHDTKTGHSPSFDREQSQALGRQAMFVLYALAGDMVASGASCIVEANFMPGLAEQHLRPLLDMARVRQVHCTVPGDVILARYRTRHEAGGRHPVHLDLAAAEELAARITGRADRPLDLDCPLLEVDTGDGWDPGLAAIVAFCQS